MIAVTFYMQDDFIYPAYLFNKENEASMYLIHMGYNIVSANKYYNEHSKMEAIIHKVIDRR